MLKAQNLHKSFGGTIFSGPPIRAVQGVSFSLARGECLNIIGESGCGKSTLARLITGLTAPDQGDIRLDNRLLYRTKAKACSGPGGRIQLLFQHPFSSFNPLHTIGKSLAEPYIITGQKQDARQQALVKGLSGVDLDAAILDRYPGQVSGGELQRAALARALSLKPDYLVLDEPTAMLDVSTQARILNLLKNCLKKTHTGMIFISHDLDLALHMGEKTAVMHKGKFVESADTQTVMNHPVSNYTKQLIQSFREFDINETQSKPFHPQDAPPVRR